MPAGLAEKKFSKICRKIKAIEHFLAYASLLTTFVVKKVIHVLKSNEVLKYRKVILRKISKFII